MEGVSSGFEVFCKLDNDEEEKSDVVLKKVSESYKMAHMNK